MGKKWTQSELTRIYRDHPELKKVPVIPIDEIVVEFLKLHDVEARPPKNTSSEMELLLVLLLVHLVLM